MMMEESRYSVLVNSVCVAQFPYTVDGLVQAVNKSSELNFARQGCPTDIVRIVNYNNICCGLDDCMCHRSGLTKQEREVLDLFGEGFY